MTANARVFEFPESFDLDALVRRQVRASDTPDPRVIAAAVAESIPAAELRGVVARLLPDHVRVASGRVRQATLGGRRGSGKWRAVAESANDIAIFRVPVCVNGTWKFLGDCSREDVKAAAADYRALAAANTARADAFDGLGRLMARRRVERVDALPASSVEEALS